MQAPLEQFGVPGGQVAPHAQQLFGLSRVLVHTPLQQASPGYWLQHSGPHMPLTFPEHALHALRHRFRMKPWGYCWQYLAQPVPARAGEGLSSPSEPSIAAPIATITRRSASRRDIGAASDLESSSNSLSIGLLLSGTS